MRYRDLIVETTKPYIHAQRSGDIIWIDMMAVPVRGQGDGRRYYERWEAKLPKDVKLIRLMAADAGYGMSNGFWEAMGFDYVYTGDSVEGADHEVKYAMWKGVNGHPTPDPIPIDEDDEDEVMEAGRLSEAHVKLPNWWRQGRTLSGADLDRLDASEFIEGDEFDYEWRLCRVPVRLLPTLTDQEIAEMDRQEPGRMDSVRDLLSHGDKATRPVVALLTLKGIALLDGWHRVTVATELGWQAMYAAVGLGERTD